MDNDKEAQTTEQPAAETPAVETKTEASPAPEMPVSISSKGGLKGMLKKPMTLVMLLLLVALAVVGWIVLSSDDEPEVTSNTPQTEEVQQVQQLAAAVTLVEGNVQFSSDGGETWADATGGETVGELDYVRTLGDGRAVVLLDDGSAIRLDSDTTVYLASSNNQYVELVLVDGQVYSRVTESASREFSVTTANDSFVAQGTAYKTSTSGEKDELEVYQSKVKVKSDGTEVEEGNKYDTNSKEKDSLDLEQLENDDFVQWNKQKDEANESYKDKLGVLKQEPAPEETPDPTPPPTNNDGGQSTPAGISLFGVATDTGMRFEWTLNNVSASNGFKLVRAKGDSTPTYGQDTSVYLSNSSSRSYNLNLKDGKSYYFRICLYRDGTCDTYSNSVQVTAPYDPPEPVVSGAVTLSIDGSNISWSIAGTAPHGYKVLLSSSENPTYPSNSIKYTSSTSATLPDKEPGTYYVRVCKYTNGTQESGCVDYSNQVMYVVSGGEES